MTTRAVFLHGRLGRRFGARFDLAVDTPAEAIRALIRMLRGFREALAEGEYRVIRGRTGVPLDGLQMKFGQCAEMHIVPAPSGAKNQGGNKVLMGVAMIALAVVTYGAASGWFAGAGIGQSAAVGAAQAAGQSTVGAAMSASAIGVSGVLTVSQIGFMGLSMILTGVSMLLSPQPRNNGPLAVDQNPSFMFTGPVNTTLQGGAVPLVYGRVRTGSVVGAASIRAEDYSPNSAPAVAAVGGSLFNLFKS